MIILNLIFLHRILYRVDDLGPPLRLFQLAVERTFAAAVDDLDEPVISEGVVGGRRGAASLEVHRIARDLVPPAEVSLEID